MKNSVWQLYRDIKKEYALSDKRKQDEYYVLFFLYRHLCFPLASFCIKFGISANAITSTGLILFVLSYGFLINGAQSTSVIGACIYFVGFILDFSDGTVARFNRIPNYFGKLIDGLVDYCQHFLFLFIGIGLAYSGVPNGFGGNWIFLGIATTGLVHFILYFRMRVAFFFERN